VRTLIAVVYVAVGVFVAQTHHYFRHLTALKPWVSAVLGVLLWPLVLVGVDLHLGTAMK
jgi:hypothetical protein